MLKKHDKHENFDPVVAATCATFVTFEQKELQTHTYPHAYTPTYTPLLLLLSRFSHVRLYVTPLSPPGFRIPGILQARTLEWVAISFSNA